MPGHYDYDSSSFLIIIKPKPWYVTNGIRYPKPAAISIETGIRDAKLLPEEDPQSDRILNQMMFVPPNYDPSRRKEMMKTIYMPTIPAWWEIERGESTFVDLKCPVDACRITDHSQERENADMVLFNNSDSSDSFSSGTRSPKQIYAAFYSESPKHASYYGRPGKIRFYRNFISCTKKKLFDDISCESFFSN